MAWIENEIKHNKQQKADAFKVSAFSYVSHYSVNTFTASLKPISKA